MMGANVYRRERVCVEMCDDGDVAYFIVDRRFLTLVG